MERREIIKLVTLATGSVLSAPLLSSLLTGCKDVAVVEGSVYELQFFKENEYAFLKKLIDIIIPKTDSPSATEVGVHRLIDTMVGTVYNPAHQKEYSKNLGELMTYISDDFENALNVLQELSKSTSQKKIGAKKALLEIKQQTVAYYLSTESVAKNQLNYLPIPGKYEACISLDEVGGKAWAL